MLSFLRNPSFALETTLFSHRSIADEEDIDGSDSHNDDDGDDDDGITFSWKSSC